MTPARLALLALLAAAALAGSGLFATQLLNTLADPATTAPPARGPAALPTRHATRTPRPPDRDSAPQPNPPDVHPRAGATAAPPALPATRAGELGPEVLGVSLGVLVALELAGGTLGLATTLLALAVRRTRARSRRAYALHTLHLSAHDEAKPQDLEDMMEAIANLARAFPTDRARTGQPFIAYELRHLPGPGGQLEWSLAIRCPPTLAVALDGTLSAAYPDVRLGHLGDGTPRPDPTPPTAVPGHVIRLRKRRGFVYPLLADGDQLASPPLEAIAHTQAALAAPSLIRFTLTPAPESLEALARRRYRRHENRLVRQERWGLPEGGLTSTLNRAEMTNAQRTQNRSLFWLEAVIAAADPATCRQLASAVQARRGENRLHRRWLIVRQNLYRRRFPAATPPLLPSPRALISAAEAAHLLALPTARMKGVPVRRLALPRIPMPPEILRAPAELPVATPPAAADTAAPPARLEAAA